MAIVANTFTTYDAKGNREDLSDIIYNISPEKTPFVSMCSKGKAEATLFEWQTESLAATDTTNAQLDGDDLTSWTAVAPTTRSGNYTQISRKEFLISGTQEKVNKAGRKSEISHQTAKKGMELRRDIEAICFAAQAGVAGNTTTARKTAALNSWVKTNTDFGGSGVDPAWTSGVPNAARTDGTQRAFTETLMKTVLQEGFTSGAEFTHLFVGPVNKQVASGFAGIATKNYDLSGKPRATAIVAAADVYVSDFGVVEILPSRFQRERDAWLLDFDFLEIATLRPFQVEELAKTGDGKKFMMLQEWGLRVKNEAALGIVADLNT